MRLQLTAVALVLAAAPARAEPPPPEATATLRVYADDDHLTVVSPAAHAQIGGDRLATDVDLTIDAVTAASVDVVTSASPRTISEQRIEAGVGLTAWPRATAAGRLRLLVSHERDYDALRAEAGATVELAQRNTTLELRGRLERDHATDAGDPTFTGDRRGAGATLALTQLLDRRTIADVTIDGRWADGWHGSPYRRVTIADPTMPTFSRWREATPAVRRALTAAVRVRRAIGDAWFTTASARGYLDDWAVHSATAAVELRQRRRDGTLLGLGARGYLQDGASFWARRYPDGLAPPPLRTADRTLGPMASAQLELIVDHRVGAGRLVVALGGLGLWFLDHVAQTRRLALTSTVSLAWPL